MNRGDSPLAIDQKSGGQRVDAAVRRLNLRPDPIHPDELPGLAEAITAEGTLRTTPAFWPDRGGMDGFFAARMIRAA